MILFPGGLSKAEWAATNSFPGTEIPGLKKETKITFKTPTEENANGKQAGGAGKQVDFEIHSKDVTAGTYTALIAAEAAQTEEFFKFTGINTAQSLILKSCLVVVELIPAEAGKSWTRIVKGSGFAANEADLMALTVS